MIIVCDRHNPGSPPGPTVGAEQSVDKRKAHLGSSCTDHSMIPSYPAIASAREEATPQPNFRLVPSFQGLSYWKKELSRCVHLQFQETEKSEKTLE
eukprot:5414907-Amphidinium_carterae.1